MLFGLRVSKADFATIFPFLPGLSIFKRMERYDNSPTYHQEPDFSFNRGPHRTHCSDYARPCILPMVREKNPLEDIRLLTTHYLDFSLSHYI